MVQRLGLREAEEIVDPYRLQDGIYRPPQVAAHRDDEYDSLGFAVLRKMQERHFWYLGRHRFLWRAARRFLSRRPQRVIDLGGGCGGWLSYLLQRSPTPAAEVALADSSPLALEFGRGCLPAEVGLYQIDLRDLRWQNRWDAAFLLDVLEHLPQHEDALRQIYRALAPGGRLFVTVPALQAFWSWVDEANDHQRRYSRRQLREVAAASGFRVLDTRYFMFLLSPLYLLSRLHKRPPLERLSREEVWQVMEQQHRVPAAPVNALLRAAFSCETPLGHYCRFPWGTSLLGVLEKPK
jgi:SAM-dependent methyltransferase